MLTEIEIKELKEAATEVRRNIVKMVHNSKSGHPGGSLSGADILTVLYKKSLNIPSEWDKSADFENRDRFILSTEIRDEKIQYHLFDKETDKMYVCKKQRG